MAQLSSKLTPFFSLHPYSFIVISSFGITSLIFITILYTVLYLKFHRKIYALFLIISLLNLIIIEFTFAGEAFQLLLSGLTIGSSLILLASWTSKFTRKRF